MELRINRKEIYEMMDGISKTKDIIRHNGDTLDCISYLAGIYNGLEIILSLIENRDEILKDIYNEKI